MDRNILRTCQEDPRRTSTDIQVSVTSPNKPVPSGRTIRRRLQVAGLHGRRPVKKPLGHVVNWFRRRRVDLLERPSQSPDFNSIEHMWEELERRLKGVRASNANQKFAQLEAAWKSIPMTVVQTLLYSMPRRCQAVIDAKAYPTKY
uniref:HTH_Tnp_Tc3_2 domain-containing protein n=1 Tax=Caenorhabditis japonica TaxID=281687 RepID=A0A8R1EQJ5_CAEJA